MSVGVCLRVCLFARACLLKEITCTVMNTCKKIGLKSTHVSMGMNS